MKKVLICDDQKMLRTVLRESVSQMRDDVEIVEAEDGSKGLQCVAQHDFDLIFLDVEMPNLNGFQVLDKIRSDESGGSKRVSIVMVTALNTDQDIVKGWEHDADGYISKPYDLDEIREALEEYLGN